MAARKQPWPHRLRLGCQAWAVQGYGAPKAVYFLYLLKIAVYALIWLFFCSFSADWNGVANGWQTAMTATAFQKAVLWSMAYEVMGFGCGSGPLTGRYLPPVGAFLHFARPGTITAPLWPNLPIVGRSRRSWFDVCLYVGFLACLLRVLCAPAITPTLMWPIVVCLPLMALSDKTIFLAARGEHYYVMAVCFLFPSDWLSAAMAIQLAIWMWAAVSKLTPNFPSVLCAMISNSAVLGSKSLKKKLYRDYPNDLRPAKGTVLMAHVGAAVEFSFPLLLMFGEGGILTYMGLGCMVVFHLFITAHFPIAVPIEWNIMVVYGGLFLFGLHPELSFHEVDSPILGSFLFIWLLVLPLMGNLVPSKVSFLVSMRYYAGNWPYSVWLFRGDCETRLDTEIIKASQHPRAQLQTLYDERVVEGSLQLVAAFRAMHLQGRVLHDLLPKAVSTLDDYVYHDGEMIAGLVLGWNFGDGHLHDENLLRSIQAECQFEPGQLRCIFVESQPLFGRGYAWRIHDAATGEIARGETKVTDITGAQPWPTVPTDDQPSPPRPS
jgi:hypothetical protein